MSMSDVYGDSEWLKAVDLKGKKVTVRITNWDKAEFNNNGKIRKQVVLSFAGAKKKFGCNDTNAKMIASMHGDKFDDWIGCEITLYPTKTHNQAGQLVDCIRVDAFVEKKPTSKPARPQPDERNPPPAQPHDMNDEIPW